MLSEMKEKYPKIFQTIEDNFKNMKPIDFIKFIIREHPYKESENDKDKKFDNYFSNVLNDLLFKYLPDNYRPIKNKEETKLKYCVVHLISEKLNSLYCSYNK